MGRRAFAMTMKCFFVSKVTDTRLKKLEKDYQSFLEQQAQLEDPVVRLEVRLRGVAKGAGGMCFASWGQYSSTLIGDLS